MVLLTPLATKSQHTPCTAHAGTLSAVTFPPSRYVFSSAPVAEPPQTRDLLGEFRSALKSTVGPESSEVDSKASNIIPPLKCPPPAPTDSPSYVARPPIIAAVSKKYNPEIPGSEAQSNSGKAVEHSLDRTRKLRLGGRVCVHWKP
jgi:hypothetical protein